MVCPIKTLAVLLTLNGVTVSARVYLSTNECNCGFGGVCLRRWETWTLCSLCDTISGRFYKNCSVIRTHCDSSPCVNGGSCRDTWGSFYCSCEPNYFGKRCEIHQPSFQKLGITSEVNVYYQVQPKYDGTHAFYVMYDPGDPEMRKSQGFSVEVNVSLSDGRVFFPSRGKQIRLNDINDLCKRETNSNPELYDSRICQLIPEGESWTYEVDVTNYFGYKDRTSRLVNGPLGEIGIAGTVQLTVELVEISSKHRHLLFNEAYNIFDYRKYRRAYNCSERIIFQGCSNIKHLPRVYLRGNPPKILAIHKRIECEGTLSVQYDWYIQRNLEHDAEYDYDQEPVLHPLLRNRKYVIIKHGTLDPGIHMVKFAEELRGQPPHYGSTTSFRTFGRCWLKIILAEPVLHLVRGVEFYAGCERRLRMPIQLMGKSYDPNEFLYAGTCDHKDDPECAQCPMQAFSIMKSAGNCNETYKFNITTTRRNNIATFTQHAVVHFHLADVELYIGDGSPRQETITACELTLPSSNDLLFMLSCIFNCFPVDTTRRTIFRSWMRPFTLGKVEWQVFLDNNLAEIDGSVVLFYESSSTRIFRVNGPQLLGTGLISSDISIKVQRPGPIPLSTTTATKSYSFQKFIDSCSLIDHQNGSYSIKFAQNFSLIYPPSRFRVFSIFNETGGLVIEKDTTYESNLRFKATGDSISVCLLGPNFAELCSREFYVSAQSTEKYKYSLQDLETMLASGDTLNFISGAVVFLDKHVIHNGTHMFWNASLSERRSLIDTFRNFQPLEQHDVIMAVKFVSMYFWSNDGSKMAGLPIFVEDQDIYVDYHKGVAWTSLRSEALSLLTATAEFFYRYVDPIPLFRELRCPLGTTLEIVAQAWALLYLQGNMIRDGAHTADEWLQAELNFYGRFIFNDFEQLSNILGGLLAKTAIPYYGLRLFGKRFVRIYTASTTYYGMRAYFNRSLPVKEDWPGFTDHVFGPKNLTNETWWDVMEIWLPEYYTNYSNLFSFVVFAAENRKGDGAITPILFFEMYRLGQENHMHSLPGHLPYVITFPLKKGKKKWEILTVIIVLGFLVVRTKWVGTEIDAPEI